jgi:hypothetical protein
VFPPARGQLFRGLGGRLLHLDCVSNEQVRKIDPCIVVFSSGKSQKTLSYSWAGDKKLLRCFRTFFRQR